MGMSEWGIPLKSYGDAELLLDVIRKHNSLGESEEVGESLNFNCILRFKGKLYAVLHNSGGRDYTNSFLKENLPKVMWKGTFKPFNKPDGWFEDNKFVWKNPSKYDKLPEKIPNIFG